MSNPNNELPENPACENLTVRTGLTVAGLQVTGGPATVQSDNVTLQGNGSGGSKLAIKAVQTDATLTGAGTVASPLHVVGGAAVVQSDNVTLQGDGSGGSKLAIKAVQTDATLTGAGTVASPLHAVIPAPALSFLPVLPVVVPGAPLTNVPVTVGKITSVNTDAGNQNATLPAAASAPNGTMLYLKCLGAFGNFLIIVPLGADTIDGVNAPKNITGGNGAGMLMVTDGVSNWVLVMDQFAQ